MPLRYDNPFATPHSRLNMDINPYAKQLLSGQIEGQVFHGPALEGKKGHWREVFDGGVNDEKTRKPLILEIGCHLGLVLRSMAKNHPEACFLGMDITYKRVVETAKRAARDGTPNIASLMANASSLEKLFAPDEIDGVVIFFPDPWVKKKRQQKNRLLSKEFAGALYHCLSEGGFVWFKTDHRPYFDDAFEAFMAAGFRRKLKKNWLTASEYKSAFQEKFVSAGLPFFETVVEK